MLGRTPPCGSYASLEVFSNLENSIEDLDECTTPEAIKGVTNKVQNLKMPIADLLSTGNKALTDIARARKTGKPNKGDKVDGGGGQGSSGTPVAVALFDEAATHGSAVAVAVEGSDLSKLVFSSPFVVTSLPEKLEEFAGQSGFKEYQAEFVALFATSEEKIKSTQDGRSGCKPSETVRAHIRSRVHAMVPEAILDDELVGPAASKTMVKDAMTPSLFGIVGPDDSFGTEKDFTPCFRLTTVGTRLAVVTQYIKLHSFMVEQKVNVQGFAIGQVRDYFKTMTPELLKKYIDFGGAVYHITLDAGALMYLPAGYVFTERLRNGSKFGCRVEAIGKGDTSSLDTLVKIKGMKDAAKKDTASLNAWVAEYRALSST